MNEQKVARGLGWFSVGLGMAELVAPRQMGRLIGVQDREDTLRLLGLREVLSGIGILSSAHPSGWLWSRVGGDAMDLTFLAGALKAESSNKTRVITAMAAVAGVTMLDVLASVQHSRDQRTPSNTPLLSRQGALQATPKRQTPAFAVITINRPASELYAFWRDFENLPRFMNHLQAVTTIGGDNRSHWIAKGPAGSRVEWDAEITADRPGEFIAWRSLPGSTVENSGSVTFTPATGGRGTVVRVELEYRPPAGALGAAVAKLFGEAPEKQIPVDLLRIKQLLETGEIARTEGQPAGRSKSTSWRYDDWLRS